MAFWDNPGEWFGDVARGAVKTVLGPIGGMAADYVGGKIFGEKNKPSNVAKNALAPPQNPYYKTLSDAATKRQQLGSSGVDSYISLLDNNITRRVNDINTGAGLSTFGNAAMGQANTGIDKAFNRGAANLTLNLKRRGLGGGVLGGGLANLESGRAQAVGNARQNVEQQKLAIQEQRQRELFNTLSMVLGQRNNMALQAEQSLNNLGTYESLRQGQGQELAGELLGEYAKNNGAAKQMPAGTAPQQQPTTVPYGAPPDYSQGNWQMLPDGTWINLDDMPVY